MKNYNQARLEIESRFNGLPHAHTTLIKSLISLADPATGLVEGLNYRDLTEILKVDHAPGRRGCGTPQKQTIRSYLRTIEDNCGDEFQLLSFGQKIKFQFLNMPKIYAYFFSQNESYTEAEGNSKSATALDKYETFNTVDVICDAEKTVQLPSENDFESSAKKVLYLTKNKLTNTTTQGFFKFSNPKQPIAADFYPSTEIIAEALAKGFENVTDMAEIAAFIRHNQANSTQWADFGPVYLQWLERASEYQQRKQATQHLRSKHYGYHSIQSNRKDQLELITEDSRDAISSSGEYKGHLIDIEPIDAQEPFVGMEGVNELIRAAFCEQQRRDSQRLMA